MDGRGRGTGRRLAGLAAVIATSLAATCLPTTAAAAPPRGACTNPEPGRPAVRPLPWAQDLLGAERAWPHSTGSGVTVAVIDSGVDADHPQLRRTGKVLPGRDFFLVGRLPGNYDCISHGTGVASIIAADPATGIGFHGIAPGVRILPVRVTDRESTDSNTGQVIDPGVLARGIVYAVDQGAKVINLSMTSDRNEAAVRKAIAYAVRKDVVVVAAVGNSQSDGSGVLPSYPAAYAGVLGVGAIDINGARLGASQIGPYVDLVGPGDGVLAATRRTGHAYVSGTSFAVPFVSAAAALVRSAWPKLTAAQVIQRLQATASPARGGKGSWEYGAGIVDPYRAVTEGMTSKAVAVPAAAHVPPDQQQLAVKAWWRTAALEARGLTGIAVGAALVLLLIAGVLAAGRRRRWAAGRSNIRRTESPTDALPEHLFS
ncbi:type VII secretion-associated serine protease mycosin [Kribbella pratensis]|uniref:Type VII secretion-associated serine protease mycosin n=1 Tax=Kribbella pratensis TaxID=2512112 RepID=A0ABY2FHA3_9ACTN|nr:type VII secretion-associated serine protease mycosin [Kribbella pratensis]TDW90435.1 type VII secretion-associated serine protease mycosin [Kribbella pratensis]